MDLLAEAVPMCTAKRIIVLTCLSGAVLAVFTMTGVGQTRGDLRMFMRQKLDLSKTILEGLSVEDYRFIAEGAEGLNQVSQDAQWRISPNINYLRLSNEFQAQTRDMVEAANDKNIDGATLAYVQMTLTCVKCHRLVRNEKLVSMEDSPAR